MKNKYLLSYSRKNAFYIDFGTGFRLCFLKVQLQLQYMHELSYQISKKQADTVTVLVVVVLGF